MENLSVIIFFCLCAVWLYLAVKGIVKDIKDVDDHKKK